MKKIIIISTTLENKADAERIAELLLDRQLIACAQISGPITSLYRWKKVTTSATEFSLSLKTTASCTEKVKDLLYQEHPYELPEIIVQEIDHSSPEYSQWVHEEVQP
ncbi:divalent-cation tolerance protein CutA [Desulfopila sp. IMCC35006]|uniref:divalent-cation tolerance protein CutA n=1 Tax=Desulfopila sp. IMCC35006 TaxID=2569542 RepID=UPI00142F1833|nr:divalent-cation tolerance protein CutA [Desulfopila sp. IMCC35006]